MNTIDLIKMKINALWNKEVRNASEAHCRAQELTRLQKDLEMHQKSDVIGYKES